MSQMGVFSMARAERPMIVPVEGTGVSYVGMAQLMACGLEGRTSAPWNGDDCYGCEVVAWDCSVYFGREGHLPEGRVHDYQGKIAKL